MRACTSPRPTRALRSRWAWARRPASFVPCGSHGASTVEGVGPFRWRGNVNDAIPALHDRPKWTAGRGKRLPRSIAKPWARLRNPFLLRRTAARLLSGALDGECAGWALHGRPAGESGTVTALVGPEREAVALVKLADTPGGRGGVRREAAVLARLHADERLGAWRGLLPSVLATASDGKVECAVETLLPGRDGRAEIADVRRREYLIRAAVATIGELHRRATQVRAADDEMIKRWVHEPVTLVRDCAARRDLAALSELEGDLAASLAGSPVAIGWQHGDFTPANVLLEHGEITGVIDWARAVPDGLAVLDVVTFLLNVDVLVHRAQIGSVVRSWLSRPPPSRHALLGLVQAALGPVRLRPDVLVPLAWL